MKNPLQKIPPAFFKINREIFWILATIFFGVFAIEFFSPNAIFFFVPPIFVVAPLLFSAVFFFFDLQKNPEKPLPFWASVISFFFFSAVFAVAVFPKITIENFIFKYFLFLTIVLFFEILAAIFLFDEKFFREMFHFFRKTKKYFLIFFEILFLGILLFLFWKVFFDPFFFSEILSKI